MDFAFTTTRPPSMVMDGVKEPPDRVKNIQGEETDNGKGHGLQVPISFRDKVLGKHAPPPREKSDLVANNLVRIEHINGNRCMLMLHVDKKLIEELSLPWHDALVIKLLGKNLGFNIMKTKLAAVWKLSGAFEIMDVRAWLLHGEV